MSGSTMKLHWASHGHLEVTAPEARRPWPRPRRSPCFTLSPICRHWSMSQIPTVSYGCGNPAILEREGEALGHAGLAQEPPRLRPAGRDVAAVAGELLQLRRRRRPWRPRHLDPRRPPSPPRCGRASARRLVAVERQGQRPAHALVVERLPLVVHGDELHAVPGALLHGDLRPQRLHESRRDPRGSSPGTGCEPAPPRMAATWADDGGHEERAVAVEIRLPLVPVVRVLLRRPNASPSRARRT